MSDDKDYRFALLDRIEDLLEQHGRSIAHLQERLARHEKWLREIELWIKDIVVLLEAMRDQDTAK